MNSKELIEVFQNEMKERLIENNHKGDWYEYSKNCDDHDVKDWIIKNLENANMTSFVDIANYAMFLYAKYERFENLTLRDLKQLERHQEAIENGQVSVMNANDDFATETTSYNLKFSLKDNLSLEVNGNLFNIYEMLNIFVKNNEFMKNIINRAVHEETQQTIENIDVNTEIFLDLYFDKEIPNHFQVKTNLKDNNLCVSIIKGIIKDKSNDKQEILGNLFYQMYLDINDIEED